MAQMLVKDDAVNVSRLFLQVGRDTRKASLCTQPPVLSALRALFRERFSLPTPDEAFPTIYLRDPDAGIFYEFESTDDLVEGMLIRLEVPDNWRASGAGTSPSPSTALSDKQRAALAKLRQVRLRKLQRQQACAQLLRADLATLRESTESAASHFEQACSEAKAQLRDVLRRTLDERTHRILSDDAHLCAHIEQALFLQDMRTEQRQLGEELPLLFKSVERMREDAARRRRSPAPQLFEQTVARVKAQRAAFDAHAARFTKESKASLKRYWEQELKRVLAEQAAIKELEAGLAPLEDSLCDTEDALQTVLEPPVPVTPIRETMDVFIIRANETASLADARGELLQQIQAVESHAERRLAAIAAAAEEREAELRERLVDPFAAILNGFFAKRGLRATGGWQAAERHRAERDRACIKAMFAPASSSLQATVEVDID